MRIGWGFKLRVLHGAILLFACFFVQSAIAQNSKVDGLKNILLSSDDDTAAVNAKLTRAQALIDLNLDSAFQLSFSAYNRAKELKFAKGIMVSSNMLGNYFQRKSKLTEAMNFYNESKAIALKLNDLKGLAGVSNNIGIVAVNQGQYPNALEAFIEGLNYELKLGNETGIAESYNNIAVVHYYQSNFEKCAEYLKKAVAISERKNDRKMMEKGYNNIGAIFQEAKKLEEALVYYFKALKISEELKDKLEISIAIQNIANVYVMQKKNKEAIAYYDRAIAIKKELEDYNGLAIIYVSVGEFYGQIKEYETAKKYYFEAIDISKSRGLRNQEMSAYKNLRQLYSEIGDYKSALDYQLLHEAVKDSVYNIEKTKSLHEMQTKFETADKEKELALREADLANSELVIKQRNNTLVMISAVFAVCLIVAIGWYNRNRYRQRQYRKQMELKQRLADAELRNKIQDERERISRDLHDHIGSQLTLIISGLDILGVKAPVYTPEKSVEQIDKLSDQARATMGQLRETIWAMNKEHVSLEMLVKKIQEFVQKANLALNGQEINAEVLGQADVIISPAKSLALFRVCQEAINNAIKHADFEKLSVRFVNREGELSVVIVDDGKGFDQEEARSRGYGLENMAFRVEECGGKFALQSAPGTGTQIEMVFGLN